MRYISAVSGGSWTAVPFTYGTAGAERLLETVVVPDNLGVMPLLARGVEKILVFVNGKEPFERSKQVESMFWPLDQQEDTGGDRSMNAVFMPDQYWKLKAGLQQGIAEGGAAVYRGRNWEVRRNEFYNVAGYSGLTICWVYNQLAPAWVEQLLQETQELVTSDGFKNFPWFSTFGENIPYVMRLKAEQVNLLASLAAWSVTNTKSLKKLGGRAGSVTMARQPVWPGSPVRRILGPAGGHGRGYSPSRAAAR